MIEVAILVARETTILQKKGTFLEGESYFGRYSKTGNCYVIRSEEGYWIPIERYDWAYNRSKVRVLFDRKATIYMYNRKRLNELPSAEEYMNGDNCDKWWYGTTFLDKQFKAVRGWE
jgi:hypothetical protein